MGIIIFLKNWTLPASIGMGTIIYLIFAFIPALDSAATFFAPIFDDIIPLFMFLILFVTFCKVKFNELKPVKWHLWVGLFQIVFSFAIVALVLFFHIKGSNLILMEAVLTCIIAPCAAAAAVVTQKLGGNLEEMTTFTFISNFITALLIPICFPLMDKSSNVTFMEAFLKILYEVCIVLLMPMLLAFIVKHCFKRFHRWVISVKDLSYYMWGGSLLIITGTTVKNIVHANSTLLFLTAIAVTSMFACIIQFAVGRFIGHRFDSVIDSGQGLGQKNTTFAIWIAYTYFSPISSIGPGCYILWQNIINSIEIWAYRKNGIEHYS